MSSSSSAPPEPQDPGPSVALAAWLGSFVWIIGFGPASTFVLLLFPDGRLPSPRWRPVAWASGAALCAAVVGIAVTPGPIEGTDIDNPFGLDPDLAGLGRALEGSGLVVHLGCILVCCASLVARYRSAGPEQRQQLKWLAWSVPGVLAWLLASVVVGLAFEGDTAVDVANALSSVGLMIVPIAITIAVLRHRLYDIDLVIKRTLVYTALTIVLLATYVVLVLVLQTVLDPVAGDSDLAVADLHPRRRRPVPTAPHRPPARCRPALLPLPLRRRPHPRGLHGAAPPRARPRLARLRPAHASCATPCSPRTSRSGSRSER